MYCAICTCVTNKSFVRPNLKSLEISFGPGKEKALSKHIFGLARSDTEYSNLVATASKAATYFSTFIYFDRLSQDQKDQI